MMKKKFIFVFISLVAIVAISCGTGVSASRPEGWIDDDTFRVVGMGIPPENARDQFERRVLSKEAALLDAKDKVVSKVVGSYVQSLSTSEKNLISEKTIEERVAGRLRGGSIIEVDWDGSDNAILTYEISGKNLRDRIDRLFAEYMEEVSSQNTAEDVAGRVQR